MKLKTWTVVPTLLTAVLAGRLITAAGDFSKAAPGPAIPTFSTDDIARTGFFYAGGKYTGEKGKEVMGGAMYVEVMVPKKLRHPNPIVFLHGAGQTGTDWLQTPDGRPGWAYFFVKRGYVVYMVDYPARGRSAWLPNADGPLTIRTAPNLSQIWTAMDQLGDWPQAKKYTQWPGRGPNKGKMGDPVFDAFNKTQVQFLAGGNQEKMVLDAGTALLDIIATPVILITHSQGGGFGWEIADARPKLVRAIITAEPAGPPMQSVDNAKQAYTGRPNLRWGVTGLPVRYDPPIQSASELQVQLEPRADGPYLVPCYLQKGTPRKLANLAHIPVLDVSGEASYHRVFDSCDAKWLNQAGVRTDYVKLEDAGLPGNGHEMMLEKNSDGIAAYFETWLEKNVH